MEKILKQPVYLLFWSESQKILPFLSVRILPHHQRVLCSSLNIMNGLDEISPAHIFSRSIHGEGFRMRRSFENGILDYRKYDSCLENALTVESPESLCKIALNRLRWPSRLEDIFREKYENVIKKYMGTAFTLAVKDQDFPMLQFICEHFSPDASALASAIDQCIEKEWGEGNAFLIEAKHKSFSKKTFDFDLDF